MARRYEIDELLWLRSSPLVAKPPGLPPIEEWMYVTSSHQPRPLRIPIAKTDLITHLYRPQPDPTTQTKQRNPRDPNNPSETTTNRRPSFFEARHISRGSNSGMPSSRVLRLTEHWRVAAIDLANILCEMVQKTSFLAPRKLPLRHHELVGSVKDRST